MQVRCPSLVGRDVELGELSELVRRLRAGTGGAVVILGEAGVGKTRLAREVVATAAAAGLATCVGRAVDSRAPVPMRPLVEALMSLTRSASLPDRAALGPYAAVLGRLVPEWSTPGSGHGAAEAPVLGEGLLRLVPHLAPRGCLLVLEDVHWADPDSLAVLEYLADHAATAPMLLVATAREDDGPAWPVLRAVAQRHSAELVRLGPLSSESVAAMVQACGVPARPELAEASAGLPLLVEELLGERDGLPRGLVDSVARRVTRLGVDATQVLLAAAVLGERFDWRLVALATGVSRASVGTILADATAAGLVDPGRHDTGDGHHFRHALIREAVLAGGTASQVDELAGRLLVALREQSPDLPGHAVILAAELAERAGDHEEAAELLVLAGARAAREGSLGSAATLLERSVAVARSRSAQLAATDALAEVHCRTGQLDAAVATTGRLVSLLRKRCDDALAHRSHLRLARALAQGARWEAAELELRAAAGVERAPDVETEPDRAELVEAELVEAIVLLGRHRRSEAAQRAAAVVDPALVSGRPDLACEACEVVGRAARGQDDEAATAVFERARSLAVTHALPLAEVSALHELGTVDMFTTGRRDRLLAARAGAQAAGAVRLTAVLDLQLVAAHHMHGDRVAAEACAHRALDGATTLRIAPMLAIAWALTACPSALTADRDAVETAIARIPPGVLDTDPDSRASIWGTSRATCSLLREDRAAAVAELETAARIVEEAPEVRPQTWWGFWVLLRAIEGRDTAGPLAALRNGPAAGNRQNLAYAELAEAVLAGRAGDVDTAVAIVERWDTARLPWPWLRHLGRRLVGEAALVDRWGGRDEPRRWLAEAAQFFDAFGTPAVAHACLDLLARPSPEDDTWHRHGVTDREAQVLALIGTGISSTRDLAAHLVISPRTVEKHVEALCRKLGVRTRSQLAVLAARQTRART